MLGIRGMTLSYWLVLFTTSCFANVLGLNLSSAFTNVITIYILIPFIIIPQLLFSGVLVRYDKLHLSRNATHEFVPFIGDLMTARWSFEALAVKQLSDNKYERQFFKDDIDNSQNFYYGSLLINDMLKQDMSICRKYYNRSGFEDTVKESCRRLNYHIEELAAISKIRPGSWIKDLNTDGFNDGIDTEASKYLDSLYHYFMSRQKAAFNRIDGINNSLGREKLIELKENYENKELKSLMVDDIKNKDKIKRTPKKFIQKWEPAFMKALAWNGRAHFYAPSKRIGSLEINTYWFNVIVIWIVSLLLYLALYYKLLQRFINYLGNLRIQKSET